MKIFIAALATETNTFSPIPTGRRSFLETEFFRDNGSSQTPQWGNIPLIEWRRLAQSAGHEVIESITAFAQPGGPTVQSVYEELRDLLLGDLRSAGPVDVILLNMHGAMVAYGYDDCEGDLLRRVRALVGVKPTIGVELDLHCHLTEAMRASTDVLITYKEYPHTDIVERAREVYQLTTAAARREVSPVIAYHDCRMVGMWRTSHEPVRSFIRRMQASEGRDGILSVSFGHGFPWGDVVDTGAKVLVIADGDPKAADRLARRLGSEIWEMRTQSLHAYLGIDDAIDAALANPRAGPVVVADVADNAGGGAPSDNTAILQRLIERGVAATATGCYWDPLAVGLCREAGVGATLDLRIGGKCGPASGQPVDLNVTVRGLCENHTQAGLSGGRATFGPSAWVSANGLDIILVSLRKQTFAPDAFTNLGCSLGDKRIVVVKSMEHFHAAFATLAAKILYVAGHGTLPTDYASIPYKKRNRNYWPRVADPFEAGS